MNQAALGFALNVVTGALVAVTLTLVSKVWLKALVIVNLAVCVMQVLTVASTPWFHSARRIATLLAGLILVLLIVTIVTMIGTSHFQDVLPIVGGALLASFAFVNVFQSRPQQLSSGREPRAEPIQEPEPVPITISEEDKTLTASALVNGQKITLTFTALSTMTNADHQAVSANLRILFPLLIDKQVESAKLLIAALPPTVSGTFAFYNHGTSDGLVLRTSTSVPVSVSEEEKLLQTTVDDLSIQLEEDSLARDRLSKRLKKVTAERNADRDAFEVEKNALEAKRNAERNAEREAFEVEKNALAAERDAEREAFEVEKNALEAKRNAERNAEREAFEVEKNALEAERNAEREALEAINDDLKRDGQTLIENNRSLVKQKEELEAKNTRTKKSLAGCDKKLAQITDALNNNISALAQRDEEVRDKELLVDKLKREKKASERQSAIDKELLEGKLLEQAQLVSDKEAELQDKEAELQDKEAELQDKDPLIERLRETHAESKQKIANLEEQLESKTTECNQLEANFKSETGKLDAECNDRIDDLLQTQETLETKLRQMVDGVERSRNHERATHNDALAKVRQEIAALEQDLEREKTALQENEDRVKQQNAENAVLKQRLETEQEVVQKSRENSRELAERQDAENAKLKNELQALRERQELENQQNADQATRLAREAVEQQNAEKVIVEQLEAALKEQAEQTRKDSDRLKSELVSQAALQQANDALQTENAALQKKAKDLDNMVERLMQDIQELRDE